MHEHPLPTGTPVRFSIADGLDVGEAIITAAEYDDGWLYRIDVTSGSRGEMHRKANGELWAWDFEVTPCQP